jgi:hypothetical protein
MRTVAKVLAVSVLVLVGCGDEGGNDNPASEPSAAQPTVTSEAGVGRPLETVPQEAIDPLTQADAYAREQFPEATDTDDALAAATSGCYSGLTGQYLGGPEGWSIEKASKIEYPEPELRAVFQRGRRDCEQ